MFKTTSQSSQIRLRRSALDSRSNTGGIDPDVFKPSVVAKPSEREELVLRKINLEQRAREMRDQIAVATHRYRNNLNGQLGHDAFITLTRTLKNIKSEIAAIDTRLVNLRVDQRAQRKMQHMREADVFVEVARELLAGPIFKELMQRTIERMENKSPEAK